MRPDADRTLQQLYWYTTAVIAAECGIELHAVQMLSTHIHEVLTDTRGELPRFLQQRNRLFANAIKCHRGWPEEVFARAPTSCVALYGGDAVLEKIGYTLANCVEAGLVRHPDDWPGVTVSVDDIGQRTIRVLRPNVYFDADNLRWPEVVELCVAMPRPLLDAFADKATSVLRSAVESAVTLARAAAAAAGRVVRSAAGLVGVSHHRQARSVEPVGRRLPSFAAAGNPVEAAVALDERRSFLDKYRKALARLKDGCRDVLFPHGTWRLHRELGFACSLNVGRSSPPSHRSQRRSDGPSVDCPRV